MQLENRRAFYRIPYPELERPRVVIGDSICEVIDCSERGIRYRPIATSPAPGETVSGRLRFRECGEHRIRGVVLRSGAEGVSLRLLGRGIPFRAILYEQIRLRQRRVNLA